MAAPGSTAFQTDAAHKLQSQRRSGWRLALALRRFFRRAFGAGFLQHPVHLQPLPHANADREAVEQHDLDLAHVAHAMCS